ncbi:HutD family protein, partial [Burkholderia cenocepacia]
AVGVDLDGTHYALQDMDTLRLDGPRRAFDVVVSGGGALLAVSLAVGERD